MEKVVMMKEPTTAMETSLVSCHTCHNLCRAVEVSEGDELQCPRCKSTMHSRVPKSLSYTWALLITGIILYIPANLWPVMIFEQFGQMDRQTIISGVAALYKHGMWPLALIVFVASICVPMAKIFALIYMLSSVHLKSSWRPRHRTMMYRATTFIGRWSMVDIFVLTVLIALVRLGQFSTITPGKGAVAFAAVVILTMLAAHTFDPRLIWDNAVRDNKKKREPKHTIQERTDGQPNPP